MNRQAIAQIQRLQYQAASLLIYQHTLQGRLSRYFLELLAALLQANVDPLACLQAYGRWFQALADKNCSWQTYLLRQIARADNPFARQVQQREPAALPPALITAVQEDLRRLQALYQCTNQQLSQWVQDACNLPDPPTAWDEHLPEAEAKLTAAERRLHEKFQRLDDWSEACSELATYYREWGAGLFAEYRALRWRSGDLVGILNPDPIRWTSLVGYEFQRETLLKNTEALLAGYPALNVLLYGSRGTGKSSLVKSLLSEYGDRGLRLIEVSKADLQDLPAIVERVRPLAQKFVIFVDDLSFEEEEDQFKALKVVLEGSVTARPQNVVVYATSNRRHLIREFFGDRPRPSNADEISSWDTFQEKLSFSDRFGLTLTFEAPDQTTYLAMVRHLAVQADLSLPLAELEYRALQWATRHNGRSGRSARQFIDFLVADLALTQP